MTRARKLLTTALAAAALLGAISFASAASLPLSGGVLTSLAVNHPCPGSATAVPSAGAGAQFTGVTVSLPSADCSGRTVQVTVLNGATVVAQGQATVSGATATVTGLTGYTAQAGYAVQATVGGWSLPITWTYTPPIEPIEPGNPQTVIQSITWSISNQNQACATVTVTTNTAQSDWWLVNLNVAQPPFYGATSGYQITDGQVEFVPLSGTAVGGVLGIQGRNNGWGSHGPTRTFTVCHYGLPTPPDVPSAYTVSAAQGTWTDTQACLATTITGNGSSSFYFGWRAQIDMAPAYQRIESSGRQVRRVQESFLGNIATLSPAPVPAVTSYAITTGWQGVLRLSEARTVTVCAYEY